MMRTRLKCLGIVFAVTANGCGTESAETTDVDRSTTESGSKFSDEPVVMRDGTRLATYVYLPEGDGPYPTLVHRTIYGLPISAIGGYPPITDIDEDDLTEEQAARLGWPLLTNNGYALVVQITRGRFSSDGVDRSWLDDADDGADLIEWVGEQPWSNGRIGVFGDSATGVSALLAASARPPGLDAVYVQVAPGDLMGEDFLPSNGGVKLESLMVQGASIAFDVSESHLQARGVQSADPSPLESIEPYFMSLLEGLGDPVNSETWMALPVARNDELSRVMPFWDGVFREEGHDAYRVGLNVLGAIEVPVFSVTVWQDVFFKSTMKLFDDLEERGIPQHLMILNGSHYEIDDVDRWPKTVMLDWFDHYLKDIDNGIEASPLVEYEIQADSPGLRETASWPPEASEMMRYYLHSDGALALEAPAADAGERSFVYDPMNPAPTVGGLNLLASSGLQDQRDLQTRDDVIGFRSEPFDSAMTIVGKSTAELFVGSDRVDTDFFVKLVDEHPDGTATAFAEDHVRLRFRDGRENEALVEPDDVVRVSLDLGDTAYRIEAGHRLRLNITSSDFPAWDRNLNTGAWSFASEVTETATNTVFARRGAASSISISVQSP